MFDFIVQLLASFLLFYGIYETGNLHKRGPLAASISELVFIGVGIVHNVWSLILIGIVLFILQTRTLRSWDKAGVRW